MMSIGKGKTPVVTTTANAPEIPSPGAGADGGNEPGGSPQSHPQPQPQPQPQETVAETQSLTTSHVSVRGTAPKVSAAGALLLERLKVRQTRRRAHGRPATQEDRKLSYSRIFSLSFI